MRRSRELMGTLVLRVSRAPILPSFLLRHDGGVIRNTCYYSTADSAAGHISNPPRSQRQRLANETTQLLDTLAATKDQGGGTAMKQRRITSQECYKLVKEWMALAKKNDKDAAVQCQKLVQFLDEHYSNTALQPTRHFHDLVLQALSATGQVQAAHEIILRHVSLAKSSRKNSRKVSAKSFHIVMNGWAKQKKDISGMRAEELYRQMENLFRLGIDIQPNHRSLTALMDAWANCGHVKAYDRIRNLLQQSVGRKQPLLDLVGFHTVLQALSSNSSKSLGNPRRAAETCEHILHIMEQQDGVQPNAQTYSLIIHAWSQCEASERQGRAAERAERLLDHMMKLHAEGADVKPNTFTFTTCMAAWSRCHQPDRAQHLLHQLVDLYDKTLDPELKPDTAAGNAVILACSRSKQPDAVEKTKRALAYLQSFAPADLVSYNAMLHAYSRAGMFEEALDLVEKLESDGTLLPDVVSYNCLLNAVGKSDMEMRGEQAEEVLRRMMQLALDPRRSTVNPTSASFTSVVQAYQKSSSPSDSVYRVYQQAMDSGAKLDEVFFVAVLQAYAKETHKIEEAWNMVMGTFDVAVDSLQTASDRLPVATLDTCHQLTESQNEWYHFISKVVEHSKETGIVSRRLLISLRRCTGNDQRIVRRLLASNTTQELPQTWSRNVPRRHRP